MGFRIFCMCVEYKTDLRIFCMYEEFLILSALRKRNSLVSLI